MAQKVNSINVYVIHGWVVATSKFIDTLIVISYAIIGTVIWI